MTLEERIIGTIEGEFLIEAYQRGYRWSEDEIKFLLNDIRELADGQKYCLQPVVVKYRGKNDNGQDIYELIDGQQRMTTLYLIMKYIYSFIDLNYSIEYTTRKKDGVHLGSRELLENIDTIDLEADSSNIDELFIKNAFTIIKNWFNNKKEKMQDIAFKLQKHVSVIWYEVDEDEKSVDIFTRLNIGKISLTNAELVKALFLNRGRKKPDGEYTGNPFGIKDKEQHEIALEWDTMEKVLHDEKFWAFISNEPADNYPVRMELLFDMIENKPAGESSYFTFNRFYEKFKKADNRFKTWETIMRYYQQLREWYSDFNLYHYIGFLVACGTSVKELLDLALNDENPLLKSAFRDKIIDMIREIMKFTRGEGDEVDYDDLSYEAHQDEIHKLLLLFNVETIRQKGDKDNRFPFNRYKTEGTWSLEHIHAQNSESLKTNDEWKWWLESHKHSLEEILEEMRKEHKEETTKFEELTTAIDKIDNVLNHIDTKNYKGSIRDEFSVVATTVINLLSDGNEKAQMHSLSNMALLTVGENAALNNSTFDVKRIEIIKMDKKGDYIPVCTWNVFMKYYTTAETQLHFWSEEDRKSYIKAMNDVLFPEEEKDGKVKLIKSEIHYGNR